MSCPVFNAHLKSLLSVFFLRLTFGSNFAEQMYPMTLGANIGTTVTGLISARVSDNIDALQVALAHLMFNVTGIIIWYPLVR